MQAAHQMGAHGDHEEEGYYDDMEGGAGGSGLAAFVNNPQF